VIPPFHRPLGRRDHGGVNAVAVLVVDDQQPFRGAARALLAQCPEFQLVGEAASGEEAVELAAGVRPELVLMDINMPGIDGFEATRRLLQVHPDTVVVLCSTYSAADLPEEATICGAQAYVDKGELDPEILTEVWAASRS
jgi:two-component system, NarL family, invasion response regulator UvrY